MRYALRPKLQRDPYAPVTVTVVDKSSEQSMRNKVEFARMKEQIENGEETERLRSQRVGIDVADVVMDPADTAVPAPDAERVVASGEAEYFHSAEEREALRAMAVVQDADRAERQAMLVSDEAAARELEKTLNKEVLDELPGAKGARRQALRKQKHAQRTERRTRTREPGLNDDSSVAC